jgi:hypothetical protein
MQVKVWITPMPAAIVDVTVYFQFLAIHKANGVLAIPGGPWLSDRLPMAINFLLD